METVMPCTCNNTCKSYASESSSYFFSDVEKMSIEKVRKTFCRSAKGHFRVTDYEVYKVKW